MKKVRKGPGKTEQPTVKALGWGEGTSVSGPWGVMGHDGAHGEGEGAAWGGHGILFRT